MEDKFSHKANDWDSAGKIAMTAKFVAEIKKLIALSTEMKVLEVGTGTGLVGLQIAPWVKSLLLIDTSPSMLKVLEQKLEQTPAANVRYALMPIETVVEKKFDMLIAFMSWHHIADQDSAFASTYELLNKGGKLIIGDLLPEDGSFHGGEDVPYLGFDMQELSAFAETYGFKVLQVYPYSEMLKPDKSGETRHYGQFILLAEKK